MTYKNYIPDEEVLTDWLGELLSEEKKRELLDEELDEDKLYGGTI